MLRNTRFTLMVVTLLCWGGIASANPVRLFSAGTARNAELQITDEAAAELNSNSQEIHLLGVPLLSGGSAEFHLQPIEVFSDDAVVISQEANGTSTTKPLVKDIKTWAGTDVTSPSRTIFISIDSANVVHAIITGEDPTGPTVIASSGGNKYRLVESEIPEGKFCQTDSSLRIEADDAPEPVPTRLAPSDTIYEAELIIDIGFKLRNRLATNNVTAQRYVADLFGATNIIYRRDLGANLKVKSIVIWNALDPFNNNLDAYRDYVQVHRTYNTFDLCHLLDNNGTGGIAYLNVLQDHNIYRVGISNVDGTDLFPSNSSTYYWDINVVAHELGHNFGSDHTHCYSPPIDCCATGCTGCPAEVIKVGTIMSYCHLHMYNGGGITMNFHNRVATFLRAKILTSPLLTPLPHMPHVAVTGNDIVIPPGSAVASNSNGTLFPTLPVGATPASRSFTIKNLGNGTLNFNNPSVSISGSSAFALQGTPSFTLLAPGGSAVLSVSFNPLSSGQHSAVVTISTNDPDTPSYSFTVSGKVAAAGPPQTFTNSSGVPIPDNSLTGASVNINVSGVNGLLMDLKFLINGSDCGQAQLVGIEHPRVSDLQLTLQSPAGGVVKLFDQPGYIAGAGANFCHTILADTSGLPALRLATAAEAPYAGSYRPDKPLSAFIGVNPNGTWQVKCYDTVSGQTGYLRSVSVQISGEAQADVADWTLY